MMAISLPTVLLPTVVVLLLLLIALTTSVNGFKTGPQPSQQQQLPQLKEPPMAFKWPIVGTLPDMFMRGGIDGMCQVHESMYDDYGEVYGMSLMGEHDEIVVCDPRVFDQVLRKEGKFPIGAGAAVTTFVEYYQENNLTLATKSMTHGPDWKEWRQAASPDMFVLWESYLPTIADACSKISRAAGREMGITTDDDDLKENNNNSNSNNIAFVDFISRAAFDMFSAVLYGESPQTTNSQIASKEDVEFVQATQRAFDITGKLMTNPLEKVFESDLYKEFVVNMDKTFEFGSKRSKAFAEQATAKQQQQVPVPVEKEFATATIHDSGGEQPSKCPMTAIKSAATSAGVVVGLNSNNNKHIETNFLNPSYIERLVNRGKLSIDEVSEIASPLLMAGVDTTAYMMSWFYLNLASNPDVQTKLAQELKSILNGEDVTTSEQLNSLPYLKACIRESHRLTPAGAIQVKSIQEDIDIVSGDGDNRAAAAAAVAYRVKAGQRVSLNLRAFPMDPKFVDNPKEYQPERFLPDAIAARKGTPSEIIDHPNFVDPFGRGKRRCMGANIAMAEIMVLAARLVQDWEILLTDPNQASSSKTKNWQPKQKLMLRADPYPAMSVVARK